MSQGKRVSIGGSRPCSLQTTIPFLISVAAFLQVLGWSLPVAAEAGPNADGALLLHLAPGLVYSAGAPGMCDSVNVTTCEEINAEVSGIPEGAVILHVLAAFSPGSQPRLAAASFGLDYSSGVFSIVDGGPCGGFELTTSGWPDPGEGTAVTWSQPQVDSVVPVYWLAGYCYDLGSLAVIPHPSQGASFADDSIPAAIDPVSALGAFGIGQSGYRPCPGVSEDGGEGGGSDGGTEEDPDGSDHDPGGNDGPLEDGGGQQTPMAMLLNEITIRPAPSDILYETTTAASLAPMEADFLSSVLRLDLQNTAALTVRKAVPWRVAADTLATDRWGRTVRVPDLSKYFVLEYESATAASAALTTLLASERVWGASQSVAEPVMSIPDDPLFQDPDYPQWYLRNEGDPGVTGEDLHIIAGGVDWPRLTVPGGKKFTIGQIDVGIIDDHEDLDLYPLTPEQRNALSQHDTEACGSHGTEMAGIAAARTNNGLGIAGVCSDCFILDLEMCASLVDCEADTCNTITFRLQEFAYALDYIGMDVVLYEAGGGAYTSTSVQAALFDAYMRGIITLAPSGNGWQSAPTPPGLPGLPFVVGVGGFTLNGKLMGSDEGCDYSETTGTDFGGGKVDIAGPGCGRVRTTGRDGYDSYASTRMLTSGAVAAVAGAAALGQSIQENERRGWGEFGPDDYAGMLINAARPYANVATLLQDYGCTECSIDDFGRGILDVEVLDHLMNRFHSLDDFQTHVVRYGDPNTLFEPVSGVMWANDASQKYYRLWSLSQSSSVPESGVEGVPQYVVWPNHVGPVWGPATTTPLWHQPTDNGPSAVPARKGRMQAMAEGGLTACELSIPDNIGRVTLRGYTVELLEDDQVTRRGWLFEPESLVMSYTYYSIHHPSTAGLDETDEAPNDLRLSVVANPTRSRAEFRLSTRLDESARLEVVDAAGRVVWTGQWTSDGGPSRAVWDCVTSRGDRVPSGVYWGRAIVGEQTSSRRIVVVR